MAILLVLQINIFVSDRITVFDDFIKFRGCCTSSSFIFDFVFRKYFIDIKPVAAAPGIPVPTKTIFSSVPLLILAAKQKLPVGLPSLSMALPQ